MCEGAVRPRSPFIPPGKKPKCPKTSPQTTSCSGAVTTAARAVITPFAGDTCGTGLGNRFQPRTRSPLAFAFSLSSANTGISLHPSGLEGDSSRRLRAPDPQGSQPTGVALQGMGGITFPLGNERPVRGPTRKCPTGSPGMSIFPLGNKCPAHGPTEKRQVAKTHCGCKRPSRVSSPTTTPPH